MGRLSRGANLASRPLPLENREGFVEGTAPASLSSPLKQAPQDSPAPPATPLVDQSFFKG